MIRVFAASAAILLAAGCAASSSPAPAPRASTARAPERAQRVEGVLPSGAAWLMEVPASWKGTVILVSRGYSPQVPPPRTDLIREPALREHLLGQGYALIASSYSKGGWALEEAVPDQLATLDEFERRFGRARRTIAAGSSMGGLVSVALVERHPGRFSGALPFCASVSGSVPMLNLALDGAFALKVLVDPEIRIVGASDWAVERAREQAAVEAAQKTPEGRARLALAAVLAQIPTWTDPASPQPGPGDHDAQQLQLYRSFMRGVMLPRDDQEARAGGVFSWNTGVDYRRQLAQSGGAGLVRELYRRAGLDLDTDLARLNAAPRIAADPRAADYMRRNYVPSGRLPVPTLTVHEIGDGSTTPVLTEAFGRRVTAAGRGALLRQTYVNRAGHCMITPAELTAALTVLERRIDTGRWPDTSPATMNASAAATGLGRSDFASYVPPPMLRPEDRP